jgi:hypothetical protein
MLFLDMRSYGLARIAVGQRNSQLLGTEPRLTIDDDAAQIAETGVRNNLRFDIPGGKLWRE